LEFFQDHGVQKLSLLATCSVDSSMIGSVPIHGRQTNGQTELL